MLGRQNNMRTLSAIFSVLIFSLITACGTQTDITKDKELEAVLSGSNGSKWYPFSQSADEGKTVKESIVENQNFISIDIDLPGLEITNFEENRQQWVKFSLADGGHPAPIGDPDLPFKGSFLKIPYGVSPEVEVLHVTTRESKLPVGTKVYPKQPSQIDSVDVKPPFTINNDSYGKNTLLPEKIVEIGETGFMRGRRVLFLKVNPVQYNPADGKILIHSNIKIALRYEGEKDESEIKKRSRLFSPSFEKEAFRLIKNYRKLDRPKVSARKYLRNGSVGADYLIITDDSFVDEVAPLAEWKKEKGYITKIVKTSDIGSSSSDIKNYIKNAYDSWSPAPSYVLLVGDHQQIPGNRVSPDSNGSYFYSDHPYSLTDGNDYWSDITVGRFSVSTDDEAKRVVEKVLKYDRYPDDGNWYSNSLIAAYIQNDYGCTASRWFMETALSVYDYLEKSQHHTVHPVLVPSRTCSSYSFRSDSYPHRPPQPSAVLREKSSLFVSGSSATSKLINHINDGVGLILHRDHGAEQGWGDPEFDVGDVNSLNNAGKTPVVFSINCLTGKFNYSRDTFAETFLRKENSGAVGVVAASEVSYSGYNDLLTHGLFTSFWPDYDSSHSDSTYSNSFRVAEALNYAKHYMYMYQGDSADTRYEYRLFHWFGDPEMEYRPVSPSNIQISHQTTVLPGTDRFTVYSSPEGALIGLVQNGRVLGRAVSNGAQTTVNLLSPVASSGKIVLTVTNYNMRPYQEEIRSVSSQGTVVFDKKIYSESEKIKILLSDSDLKDLSSIDIIISSKTESDGEQVTLNQTDPGKGIFEGEIEIVQNSSPSADGILQASDRDLITALYTDTHNSSGVSERTTATAVADFSGPQITNITYKKISITSAEICFDTSEPATARISYGTAAPFSSEVSSDKKMLSRCFKLENLSGCTDYLFSLSATDERAHTSRLDNNGNHYSFTTGKSEQKTYLSEKLDSNPGWTTTGDWEFGKPLGKGSGNPDPTSGYTGDNVYGNNLNGNYLNNADNYLQTSDIDLSSATGKVELSFRKWLNTESYNYDQAKIAVWNGTSFVNVWNSNGSTSERNWSEVKIDISEHAGLEDFKIKWTLSSDGSEVFSGWNIDDIEITGETSGSCPGMNTPPKADFTFSPEGGEAPLSVTLDASSSTDDVKIASYIWYFSDGTVKYGPSTTHTFRGGDETVKLTVVDSHGAVDSIEKSISVVEQPVADAGKDQDSLAAGTVVKLDGSGSRNSKEGGLSYLWQLESPSNISVQLANPDTSNPEYAAPEPEGETPLILTWSLTVANGTQTSEKDFVTHTIYRSDKNLPPVLKWRSIEGCTDFNGLQTIGKEKRALTIEIKAADPNPGDITTVTAENLPEGASLNGNIFTWLPSFTDAGTYEIIFKATDNGNPSLSDVETLSLVIAETEAVVANAGSDQKANENEKVTLDASASLDSENLPLTFKWSQLEGPMVSLDDMDGETTSFETPTIWKESTLIFKVEVCNSNNKCDSDTVSVVVSDSIANTLPVAHAGSSSSVREMEEVMLDSSGSKDPDGGPRQLTHSWSQTAGTQVSLHNDNSPNPSFRAPLVAADETLTFRVEVCDGLDCSGATVDVEVKLVDTVLTDFLDDFETGILSKSWVSHSTNAGRIAVSEENQPYSGNKHLEMASNYGDSLNELILFANLENQSDIYLQFAVKEFDDEDHEMPEHFTGSHNSDGIAVSVDGINWYKVTSFVDNQETNRYSLFRARLDDTLSKNGLSFSSKTLIKFQQYGMFSIPQDGFSFDRIELFKHAENQSPVAEAGDDQTVEENTTVTLNGIKSADPDNWPEQLRYKWSQIEGVDVELKNSGSMIAQFQSPSFWNDPEKKLKFKLEVCDGLECAGDIVEVTVLNSIPNGKPVVSIAPVPAPSVNKTVELDASGSHDPDKGPEQLTYSWVQTSGDPVALRSADSSKASFKPDYTYLDKSFTFEVEVCDGEDCTKSDIEISFTVERAKIDFFEDFESEEIGNWWIFKSEDGGRIRVVSSYYPYAGNRHMLMDSSGSYRLNEAILHLDASNIDNSKSLFLEFFHKHFRDESEPMPDSFAGSHHSDGVAISIDGDNWYRVVDLTNSGGISWRYKKFSVDMQEVIKTNNLQLDNNLMVKFQQYDDVSIDSDGFAFDNIKIFSRDSNVPPVADAGDDQTVDETAVVTLDGSGSLDSDNWPKPLTYNWRKTSGRRLYINNSQSANPTFTAPKLWNGDETFTFELEVCDGMACAKDSVTVTVTDSSPNEPPTAVIEPVPTVKPLQSVILDASGSTDADNGPESLKFNWSQLEGPTVEIDSSTRSTTSVYIPYTAAGSNFKFSIEVCDGMECSTETVSFAVENITFAETNFHEDFETESLAPYWIPNSTGNGRIYLSSDYSPNNGTYHLLMDSSDAYALNEAILAIEILDYDQGSTMLEFFHKHFDDEGERMPQSFTGKSYSDGVAISLDGIKWYKARGLTPYEGTGKNVYKKFSVNLSELATSNGIQLQEKLFIKFQQYDNSSIAGDGFAFDDISVFTIEPNVKPIADAGENQTADENALVTLDGSASFDQDNKPQAMTFSWKQISGPIVTLDGAETSSPSFMTPPTWTGDTLFTFELTVCDGQDCSTDQVSVTEIDSLPNIAPEIRISTSGESKVFSRVVLDASASTDPDGGPDPITFKWRQTEGTDVTLEESETAAAHFATDLTHENSTLKFEVEVCDGKDCSQQVVSIHIKNIVPTSLDFNENFESATLGDHWITHSTGKGRVRITDQYDPYEGSGHLVMDTTEDKHSLNQLDLYIDLENVTGNDHIFVDFQHKSLGDESRTMPATFTESSKSDGVAISIDNHTFFKLQGLTETEGASVIYKNFKVDITEVANRENITLSSRSIIRFQQFDNLPADSDGASFDNIRVYKECVPDCTNRECGGDGCGGSCGSCNDSNECTQDSCSSEGKCIYDPEPNAGKSCDDGLFCTVDERCNASGTCISEKARNCSDDLFCNGEEVCNEELDRCQPGDDPCGDDNTFCNGTESCNEESDKCESSGNPCPDDGLFCNGAESCDEESKGCVTSEAPCRDDGLFCNGTESCNEESDKCESLNPPCSDDSIFCNGDETCNEQEDLCEHTGNPCIDGSECNSNCNEEAQNCFNIAGTVCGDQNDTTCDKADTCDGAGSCTSNFVENSISCDDNNIWTENDVCFEGKCVGEESSGTCYLPIVVDELPFEQENQTIGRESHITYYDESCEFSEAPTADIVYEIEMKSDHRYTINVLNGGEENVNVVITKSCEEHTECIREAAYTSTRLNFEPEESGIYFIILETKKRTRFTVKLEAEYLEESDDDNFDDYDIVDDGDVDEDFNVEPDGEEDLYEDDDDSDYSIVDEDSLHWHWHEHENERDIITDDEDIEENNSKGGCGCVLII